MDKIISTVIDIFSKFVCIISLNRKSGQEVANAFSRILNERRPGKIWVDKGREFYNKDVQKLVELYSTERKKNLVWLKGLIELLSKKMFQYISANNVRKFVDVRVLLEDGYSNTIHSSIKMTPKEAGSKKNENSVEKFMFRIWWKELDTKMFDWWSC